MAEQPTDPGEDWAQASVEQLKEWRVRALRLAEKAGEAAEDVRRQAEMYSRAGQELETQAFRAEALAKQHEAGGDAVAAAGQHKLAGDVREQAQRNYRVADEKGRQAMEREREAYRQKMLAERLAAQIKKRISPLDS